jgi:hypothetical protein
LDEKLNKERRSAFKSFKNKLRKEASRLSRTNSEKKKKKKF